MTWMAWKLEEKWGTMKLMLLICKQNWVLKYQALVAWPGPVFHLGPSSCDIFSIQLSSTIKRWYIGSWHLISCAEWRVPLLQPRQLCWEHEAHSGPRGFIIRCRKASVDLLTPRTLCGEVISRTASEIICGLGNIESSRNVWLNFTVINQRDKYTGIPAM